MKTILENKLNLRILTGPSSQFTSFSINFSWVPVTSLSELLMAGDDFENQNSRCLFEMFA